MTTHKAAARTIVVVLISLSAEAVLNACPICFQIEDSHVINGVRAAVGVLMGVTGVVLAGFAVFVTGFVRRTNRTP